MMRLLRERNSLGDRDSEVDGISLVAKCVGIERRVGSKRVGKAEVARHFIVGSLGGKHITSVRKRHPCRGNHERSPKVLSLHPMLASLRDDSMARRERTLLTRTS
jgi:hypothetical protein